MYTSSSFNVITGNIANSNGAYGIHVYDLDSSSNTIYNNYFANTNNAYDKGNND